MTKMNKLIQEYNHDPYFLKEKCHDPSVCERCGVVFHDGRFEWLEKVPAKAKKISCPACKRIEDNYEGGFLCLEGEFLSKHKDDILNIIKNTEKLECKYRPLERIIEISDKAGKIEIKTTYEHIARRIGEAIHKACKGELNIKYPEGEKYVRVHWCRNS
ncbi:MAG: BCAM0308 family protein [Proteobacteria bacterium]|nr:BCAM0308 family protein [Pseudomonadota bacterium]